MNTTITIMLVIFFVLLFVGVPVAFSIGASAIFALLIDGGISMVVVPQRMFVQLNSFSLMAIPLFILAGELMGASGITGRIVKFASRILTKSDRNCTFVKYPAPYSEILSMIFCMASSPDAQGIYPVSVSFPLEYLTVIPPFSEILSTT